MIIILSSVELESGGKVVFEINLVCGKRVPVAAEEFEHAQWLRRSELRVHGVHRRNVGGGCDVTNATNAGPIFYSWIVFDGVRKSSFKSQRSSSLG